MLKAKHTPILTIRPAMATITVIIMLSISMDAITFPAIAMDEMEGVYIEHDDPSLRFTELNHTGRSFLNGTIGLAWINISLQENLQIQKAIPCDDGGILLVLQDSVFNNKPGFWLYRMDAHGDIIWTKEFYNLSCYNGIQFDDGSFFIVGETSPYNQATDDIWYMKIDISGERMWHH